MKEIIKKLVEAGRAEALNSLEDFKKAAAELGYTEEQVEEALEDFDGFPLDDDDLDEITGGAANNPSAMLGNTIF
ncbi:MAG: hypothetical protein K5770_03215 [Lachnospiraceae bacterium]|nr:hypothetical protein [Lachnospiraceae bacterium]